MDEFNAVIAKRLRMFAAGVSLLAIVFGCWVLFGWVFDVSIAKTIIPGQVAVKANTALCFILIGLALWLRSRLEPLSGSLRMTVGFATLTVGVVGAISFSEFLTGWDPGFDQLLIKVGPEDAHGSVRAGLMSPVAAASFVLLGAALATVHTRNRIGRWWVQLCVIAVTVGTIFGVLDFVLDAGNTHTYISPLTAFVLLVLALSIPLVELEYGLGRFFASDSSGGTLIRRLLPACIVIPIGLGWLRWRGEEAGLFSGWVGVSLMVVGTAILLASIVIWTAHIADTTDRERLRTQGNNLRLAAIVNCSNEAIIGKTQEGIITSWNPGAEAIYGYTAQEMIGQSVSILIPAEHQSEFQEILGRISKGEEIRGYESERIRKDGTKIMVSLSVAPIRDATGALLGASTIARDITEQKRAQEEIKRSSLYARSLIEASVDPLVTISKAGKIMDVNQATEQATGFTREQLIGTDFSDYFTEPEKARAGYERVFSEETVHDYPLALRHRSGQIMEVLYNASVFRNQRGEVEGVFAAARDVTERNQAERGLKQSETRYRSLVTATSQIVWSTDASGKVVGDMPLWRSYTGATPEQIMGGGWIDSLHPDDRERTADIWIRAVRGRSLYDTEYRIRRQDGEYRFFSVRGVPVLDDSGSIQEWIGTCTDITERKQAEEALHRLNQELESRVQQRTAQLQAANQELESFTYSVSHDLRAPLRHISGFSKILSEDFSAVLPQEAQHLLQRIEEGTRRMGMLVDDLLNLGRVGRHEVRLQVTGLDTVVKEVLTDLQPESENRKVEWKIGRLPYVECDAPLMKQVFQNLLSNALKFTRPREQAVIEVGCQEQNGIPIVFVRDNGVGFSMKYADKLFGVFQRLHRTEDFEGTGVGLATVQRIVQKHGGRIWAEAELDKGATFYFTLNASESVPGKQTSQQEKNHESTRS
jgi:PAS domain S-box-containing protein